MKNSGAGEGKRGGERGEEREGKKKRDDQPKIAFKKKV